LRAICGTATKKALTRSSGAGNSRAQLTFKHLIIKEKLTMLANVFALHGNVQACQLRPNREPGRDLLTFVFAGLPCQIFQNDDPDEIS
jgi:hypothetical protein